MGQSDLAMKELTSYSDVAADILNVIVYAGEQVVQKEDLKPYVTESSIVKTDGKLKRGSRDNCLENIRDGTRYLIIGIENQEDVDYTMPMRVMGYDYAVYERQVEEIVAQNKESGVHTTVHRILKGQKISPVVTLVLYAGSGEDMPTELSDMLEMPQDERMKKYIKNYEMNLICLRQLSLEQVERFQSDFRYIAKQMSRAYNKKQLKEEMQSDEAVLVHTKATLHALMAFTGDERYLAVAKQVKEGETKMCEILDAVEKEGYEKGVSVGVQQGIAQGVRQGIAQGVARGEMDKTRIVVTNMIKRGMSDEDIIVLAECEQALIDEVRAEKKK